jgi:hypothetical protein
MTPLGPDWDAFDSAPLTAERREAAKLKVIAAARDVVGNWIPLYAGDPLTDVFVRLVLALHHLDAVGTPDERKP